MKFVLIVVIVCAIALNVSFNFVNSLRHPIISARNGTYRIPDEKEEVVKIVDAWAKCNWMFREPFDKEIDLFPVSFSQQNVTIGAKCLLDCTLRKTGVMTDSGLRYTDTFTKIRLIKDHAMRFSKNCFAVSADLLRSIGFTRNQFNHYICYEIVWSITENADHCRHLEDPEFDNCETSWMVMRCMTKEHNGKLLNSSYVPIVMNDLKLVH